MKKEEKEVKEEGSFKMKKKPSMKKLNKKDEPIKVDLSKKKKDAIQESGTGDSNEVIEGSKNTSSSEIVEKDIRSTETAKQEKTGAKEEKVTPTIEEIKEEEFELIGETTPVSEPGVEQSKSTPNMELPENVEKLVAFMKETGGDMKDYIRLNCYNPIPPNVSLPCDSKSVGNKSFFLWFISSLCCVACSLVLSSFLSSFSVSVTLLFSD